jgi:hypothetical protein
MAMVTTDTTITLGGREFAIHPLRLGELRPVLDALDAVAGQTGGALVDAAVRIVHAGLAASHPELRIDDLLGLEATLDELNAAVAAILRRAGLVPRELAPGESHPVAGQAVEAQGSATSMAPSPPVAVTNTARSTP